LCQFCQLSQRSKREPQRDRRPHPRRRAHSRVPRRRTARGPSRSPRGAGLRPPTEGSMAGSVTGPEQARQDLADILSGDRVEMGEALALMAERGHPPGRVDRARRALEVETVREGPVGSRQRFSWQLPGSCPTCLRPFGPDAAAEPTPWGGNRPADGDYWQKPRSPIEPVPPEPAPQPTPPPPPRYEPVGPPVCSVCRRASAMPVGGQCPWQTVDGRRCVGVLE
jgi:hypothetical protein